MRRALIEEVRRRYSPGGVSTLWGAASHETAAERFGREVSLRWEEAAEDLLEHLAGLEQAGVTRRDARGVDALEAREARRPKVSAASASLTKPRNPPASDFPEEAGEDSWVPDKGSVPPASPRGRRKRMPAGGAGSIAGSAWERGLAGEASPIRTPPPLAAPLAAPPSGAAPAWPRRAREDRPGPSRGPRGSSRTAPDAAGSRSRRASRPPPGGESLAFQAPGEAAEVPGRPPRRRPRHRGEEPIERPSSEDGWFHGSEPAPSTRRRPRLEAELRSAEPAARPPRTIESLGQGGPYLLDGLGGFSSLDAFDNLAREAHLFAKLDDLLADRRRRDAALREWRETEF